MHKKHAVCIVKQKNRAKKQKSRKIFLHFVPLYENNVYICNYKRRKNK